ncbi:MAG: PIN domain-containing protein [Synergistaceae bacterium]|nr:PIN domain-containing protein [Synergistaceae bacterium]
MSWGSLCTGHTRAREPPTLSRRQRVSYQEVIPFGFLEAKAYGQIRASLERKGQVIGYLDMLIAATALTHNATLITNNTQEFSRIDGLKLNDWTI